MIQFALCRDLSCSTEPVARVQDEESLYFATILQNWLPTTLVRVGVGKNVWTACGLYAMPNK